MNERLVRKVELPCPVAKAFAWHARSGAFQRLTPPWERVELESADGGIRDGGRVELKSFLGPFPLRWVAEHFDFRENEQFCDRQRTGPFAHWEHRHRFESTGAGTCRLIDDISYRLPFAPFSNVAKNGIRRKLDRMFDYRHTITRQDLRLQTESPGRVLVTGASGLIGRALIPFLQTKGWEVDRLVRRSPTSPNEIEWSPHADNVEWSEKYHCDAVIHLAGANVGAGRWTDSRKKVIRESRTMGTQTLVKAIGLLARPPNVVIGGSATGIYGDTGSSAANENTPLGKGFLADVCDQWEDALAPLRGKGVRVVMARTGVVLSPAGGTLAKMLSAFKFGFGGRLGSGNQWLSWIGIDDWLHAVHHVLINEAVSGPVNLTSPEPVTQIEFARTLAKVLSRPALVPAPASALRLILGEMADETLLANSRVAPEVLRQLSFEFLHPSLEKALRHVLGRQSSA